MIELPDDELDKLFRKSSEELDPQYDPEDWNNLKKRLDQHDGRTGGAWFKKWWPLGLLLLLIPAGIATYSWKSGKDVKTAETTKAEYNSKPEISGSEEAGDNSRIKAKQEQGLAGRLTDNEELETQEDAGLPLVNDTKIALDRNTEARESRNFRSKKRNSSKPFPKSELKAAALNSRPLLPRSRSKAGGVYLEPNRSKTEGGDGALILSENSVVKEDSAGNGLTNHESGIPENELELERMQLPGSTLENRQASWTYDGAKPEITFVKTEIEPEPVSQKEEVQQAKWAVRFGYSPDLSTVGGKNFTKPGSAVALLAELSVLPRLFVQTGAVWSRKDYFAGAENYILNPRWGYATKPESVDGICKVLEIPLNLRYDIVSGQKSRFFLGTGVSSYYMLNEKYKYNYKYPDDPHIKYQKWQGSTGWYFLSHLNASAGYEYRISNKLSLLGEPYARIPLKRVGYGKVNLVTMGFWLSLRYTPAFR